MSEKTRRKKDGEDKIFNQAGQAWNHIFYWDQFTGGPVAPTGDFAMIVERDFGSFDGMVEAFGKAADGVYMGFSGDYAGYAQIAVERDNPGATALFVAGCGADQNPIPRRKVELAEEYGRRLAGSVAKVLAGPLRPIAGRLGVSYEEIDLDLAPLPGRDFWEKEAASPTPMIAQRAAAFLKRIDAGQPLPAAVPYPVQAWALGDDLTWILLGGEVVVDYSLRLKRNLGPSRTWVTAYANDVMAYIPSERVLAEGGLESRTQAC